jgi:hypothetical protein
LSFDDHRYLVVLHEGGLGWNDANAAAPREFGPSAHLAAVTSEAENDFIGELLADPASAPVWHFTNNAIGPYFGAIQNDGDPKGDPFGPDQAWEWITGEAWQYTNWAQGEPNNGDGGPGEDFLHYLALGEPTGKTWNDINENFNGLVNGYVVEVDCIADCNADGALNILDFVCFQSEWRTSR